MLSASVVTYNSEKIVEGALDSINNSITPIDTFVIDNASEDQTCDYISTHYPNVNLIRNNENVGFGKANNMVIDKLQSTYHIFINPDVTFQKDVPQQIMHFMNEHPDVAIVTPRVIDEDGKDQFLPKLQPRLHYMIAGTFEKFGRPFTTWRKKYTGQKMNLSLPCEVQFATGCFLFIRTDVLKKIKGYDERFFMYMEDADLSRRALDYGKILYHPEFVITHAWARESNVHFKGRKMHIKSMFQFMRKWGVKL